MSISSEDAMFTGSGVARDDFGLSMRLEVGENDSTDSERGSKVGRIFRPQPRVAELARCNAGEQGIDLDSRCWERERNGN